MKYLNKIHSFLSIMKFRFLKKRTPVAIRWQLTNRCTQECIYCKIHSTPSDELSLDQIKDLLNQVAKAGTKRISFSGGDPLLKKDFKEIISHGNSLGISCSINSNGFLIEKKIDAVKLLDLVKLSLDGPKEVHESQKGEGSYTRVIHAADVLKEANVKFTFACTITKHNVDHLDHVLEMAQKHDTMAAFQPLKELYRGVENIDGISPDIEKYRAAVRMLIEKKQKGNKHIRNSQRGLFHILKWPDYNHLQCGGGNIFCMIETDGRVTPCDRLGYNVTLPSALEMGFVGAFDNLPPIECNGCGFCGALELNYILDMKFDVIPVVDRISK